MDVEAVGFVDVGADAVEEDGVEEELHGGRGGGDEDACCGVDGVGGPGFRAGDGEEGRPGGKGGEDFEGFGEGAGFVAREEGADFGECFGDFGGYFDGVRRRRRSGGVERVGLVMGILRLEGFFFGDAGEDQVGEVGSFSVSFVLAVVV